MNYTILISITSLLISAFIAGWTIYRDIIQKPRFKVDLAVRRVIQAGAPTIGPFINVSATNYGPLPNRIGLTFARHGWIARRIFKKESAMITHDHAHIANTAKSQRVEVGDRADFIFPIDAELINDNFSQIGVSDGYGRIHWASKKQTKNLYREIRSTIARLA